MKYEADNLGEGLDGAREVPGETEQLLSPTTLGHQAVASSFLQALEEVLSCSKSQGKSQGAQLVHLLRPIPHIPHWMTLALLVVPFYCF